VDLKAFLQAVVPWDEGYATIHGFRPEKGFSGRSCATLEKALAAVEYYRTKTRDHVYFCLSRQKFNSGKRTQDGAISFRCVFMDMDIKADDDRCPPTLAEALASLFYFCQLLNIPRPSIIVHSGGGLHIYWLSDRDLPVEQWYPFAAALKAAVRNSTLKVKDIGITTDAARVLRVPETLNYKYDPPRKVWVMEKYSTLVTHDFSKVFSELLKLDTGYKAAPGKRPVKPKLGPAAKAFAHLELKPLGEGVEELPPLSFPLIKASCGWLREAHETGGKDYDQPQWNLTTLCSTWMENGNALAHEFGNQHPEYDPRTTEELWSRKIRERRDKNIGWPSCRTIHDSGSQHCKSCPIFAAGKSPLNLGIRNAAAGVAPEAGGEPEEQEEINEELEALGGTRPKSLRLPKGFAVNKEGFICAHLKSRASGKSIKPAKLLQLFLTKIKNPSLQFQAGSFGLGFIAKTDNNEKEGWQEVIISSANMKPSNLLTHLYAKCVLPNPEKEAIAMIDKLPVSWLAKLLNEDKAVRDSGTLGWRYTDGKMSGFVYGGVHYRDDGDEVPIVAAANDDFYGWYMPVGKKEVWLKACKLLTDRKRPELDILIAIAFAAPLMPFAGALYGAILSVWGEPGTAKSTAQQVAAAVWGHPKQTRESLNSTPKSVQGRLGRTRNLPAYWDDIQDERHQESLFQTMFVATEGAEGGRLNTDASMKARLEWQTLLTACSNASFVEFLAKKQKSTTAGMRRVLEFEFNKLAGEPGMVDATDASKIFSQLEHNYGMVGVEYARILATEHRTIDVMVSNTIKKFAASVEGTGDESFWWGLCGVLLAGAQLARRLGAEMDIPAMERFLHSVFIANRKTRGNEGTESGKLPHVEQALVNFLNDSIGNVIFTDKLFEHKTKTVHVLNNPLPGRPLHINFVPGEGVVVISKKAIREYLQKHEIKTRQVFAGLETFFKAKENKMTLAAGTAHAQGQEVCLVLPIPRNRGHVLQEFLQAYGPSANPSA
jgi:hypothetical protein